LDGIEENIFGVVSHSFQLKTRTGKRREGKEVSSSERQTKEVVTGERD